jgi:hypothetical protein
MKSATCHQAREQFDELLDGGLSPEAKDRLQAHLAGCPACAEQLAAVETLRMALRRLPVPPLRPGFMAEALAAVRARATASAVGEALQQRPRKSWRPRWRRVELWLGATVGAAAAAVLMVVLLGGPQPEFESRPPADFRVALYEPREIGLAIDAESAMPGATLTINLSGGIELLGFADRRELSWETDLDQGTNLLSLPIIAHSLEDGHLTALVEHGSKTRRIELRVQVDSPETQ